MADKVEKKRRDESPDSNEEGSIVEGREGKRKRFKKTYVNIGDNISRWKEIKEELKLEDDENLATILLKKYGNNSETSTPAGLKDGQTETDSIIFENITDSESNVVPTERNADIYSNGRYASNFQELERLGKGGFGTVYKSKNKLDDIVYAVKIIKFTTSKPEEFEKVQREVTALAKLKHTNIVRYNTSWLENVETHFVKTVSGTSLFNTEGEDDDKDWASNYNNGGVYANCDIENDEKNSNTNNMQINKKDESQMNTDQSDAENHKISRKISLTKKAVLLYIQMELCSQTLKKWMWARNEVNQPDSMNICSQMLQAADYMHCKGVIHRDLKPTNIFLVEGLHVKVGDFGLAKEDQASAIAASPARSESSPALSTTGSIKSDHTSGVGTQLYAAPEQLTDCSYDFKCDIYSLGIIIFELFNIFRTDMEHHKILQQLREGEIPDMFRNGWPKLTDLIVCMTSKSPDERPSAEEIMSREIFAEIEKIDVATKETKEIEELRRKIEQLELQLQEKNELLKEKDRTLSRLNSMEN